MLERFDDDEVSLDLIDDGRELIQDGGLLMQIGDQNSNNIVGEEMRTTKCLNRMMKRRTTTKESKYLYLA